MFAVCLVNCCLQPTSLVISKRAPVLILKISLEINQSFALAWLVQGVLNLTSLCYANLFRRTSASRTWFEQCEELWRSYVRGAQRFARQGRRDGHSSGTVRPDAILCGYEAFCLTSRKVVVCGHCLVTLSITSYWNIKIALIAAHLNAGIILVVTA